MALVKQCDRCKAIFKYDPTQQINCVETGLVNGGGAWVCRQNAYDLCPKCMTLIHDILTDGGSFDFDRIQHAYDVLTAHPFVDNEPHKHIEEATGYLGEVLDI